MFGMQTATALGYFFAEQHEVALAWAEAAVLEKSNFLLAACVATASAALAGKRAEAGKAMARLRQIDPALNLSNFKDLLPFRRPEDFARFAEGLRLAGLPE
jgi:hypothetical protein